LNETTYALIDELIATAKALDTSPARVALAWVQTQPAVTSTIIGARTAEQLDQNLGALELRLPPERIAKLEALSAPKLNFPAGFLAIAPAFMHGGLSVNGVAPQPWPFNPREDSPRF
jgi:diketogulonate reductase-like aldo/keto reductase